MLDVGCGYGFLLECTSRFGIPAIGIEGGEGAIARGRSAHPLVDVRQWRAGDDLPFNNDFVGGAILNEFIDHISVDEEISSSSRNYGEFSSLEELADG